MRAFKTAFSVGECVRAKVDPRHEGRVVAVFACFTIRVQFPNGWKADYRAEELERVK